MLSLLAIISFVLALAIVPSPSAWSALNKTVGGRLLATIPLGSPCHDPNYDEALCSTLRRKWRDYPLHIQSPSSVMSPLFVNNSCNPFQPRDTPCELASFVRYTAAARDAKDVAATVKFAKRHNVRLVIKNTGHDYLGRSTGAGALSIWTQGMKEIRVRDWADKGYVGKALRVGAGVLGSEALAAARDAGLVVVTGSCPSVGLAGGYTQGGGHSSLSNAFGLAADNTLSFDVVTASGRLVTASPWNRHRDLYWALSGGGGGNFGVVVSLTVKAHPDARVAGAELLIQTQPGMNGVDAVFQVLPTVIPAIVGAGFTLIHFANKTQFVGIATGYNKTQASLRRSLEPLETAVKEEGLTWSASYTEFPHYQDHYEHHFNLPATDALDLAGITGGGHFFPGPSLANLTSVFKDVIAKGATFFGIALDVSTFGSHMANAVSPHWRQATVSAALCIPVPAAVTQKELEANRDKITNELQPLLEAAAPGTGAYMNEADFQEPDFQTNFFGTNYPALLRIKNKYDPHGFFYATAAVGSEKWQVGSDGRLCRRRS
ncbi:putative isoamyl alcohol oxidase [Ophiocordyceps camponoti-floridani]|uniref:Putative isoamyl alcohol oxidase n=1 Tax=Ophiocordyceps camponoti-floridani TaxID=2030778 RepID=A0A8H4QAX8_9HYPO|nr:putative isoamyl alcohol oxidase [Ophiocordyceps camponoti-floridani]